MIGSDNAKEVTYYNDPKYNGCINKNNDRNSGANPFYLYLPGSCHLIYENNTGVGQKQVVSLCQMNMSTGRYKNMKMKEKKDMIFGCL